MMQYRHIFGPVPSRRLGLSLGVDLIPYKTCSLDCIYCECGKTTILTTERKEYIPTKEVIKELDHYLKTRPTLDHVTFSGSGEPTLHSGLGEIVKFLKKKYSQYPIALLTNSTLLGNHIVQNEIQAIDLVLPSMDAISDDIFKKINRPAAYVENQDLINGLIDFRHNYLGKIWIEVFIIPGINNHDDELTHFKEILTKIKPDKIQLNSIDRPGTEKEIVKATEEELNRIKIYLNPLPVEIIAKYNSSSRTEFEKENIKEKIVSLLKRRPCSAEDINKISQLSENEINRVLLNLLMENKIEEIKQKRRVFYRFLEK